MSSAEASADWLRALVERALQEDVGTGDVTTDAIVPAGARAAAVILARAPGVIAGTAAARSVFEWLEPGARWRSRSDGTAVQPGDEVAHVDASGRTLLTGERTALNLLQRMSGVATLTRAFVDALGPDSRTRIVDTRKTTPGLRVLEKAAVRAGGGTNHRFGLHDMVLIKENHIAVAGGIGPAAARARDAAPAGMLVEVEVRNMDEFRQALDAGVDRILLDNMNVESLRLAVQLAGEHGTQRPELEASGNMTLERVAEVAATGVDLISVGALTHSAPALDLSMLIRTG